MPVPSPISTTVAALAVSAAAATSFAASAASPAPDAAPLVWTRLADLPDALGVAGPYAGVSNGAMIVAGGANFPDGPPWEGHAKAWHDAAYVLDAPAGAWRTLPNALATPRGYGVSLTTPDGLLCIGGAEPAKHLADVTLLSWSDAKLARRELPPLPTPLAYAAGAIVRSTVYVAGGTDSPTATAAAASFFALDLDRLDAGWHTLPPCPGPARMLASAAAANDSFYLVGGVSLAADAQGKPARTYLLDTWRFDVAGGRWTRLADLPRPAAAAPTPAMNIEGGFAILGGDDGVNVAFEPKSKHPGFAANVLAYDVAADGWRTVAALPIAQVTTPLVPWRGGYIIPSGEVRPGVRTPQIWSVARDVPPVPYQPPGAK